MRTNVVLNMVLIDTSVLINYLKNVENQYTNALNTLIENHYPIGINDFIYMEILHGAKSEKEYEILKKYLGLFHFYQLEGKASYEKAADLQFNFQINRCMVLSWTGIYHF